jgi:predicted DsbA family dithiol-disulfide isomerase
MPKLTIDAVSDVVCPWCFLGGEYLFAALALAPELETEVRWRPFQLDPNIPGEGVERVKYMRERFGEDQSRFIDGEKKLAARGAELGINFKFDAIKKMPNTLDAHRLILWASQSGPTAQSRVARALFSAHFEHGIDIGDPAALIEIARAQGLDAGAASAFLYSGAGVENVLAEIEAAHRIGVEGVPFFLINGKYSVFGAQPPEALAKALRQAAAEG